MEVDDLASMKDEGLLDSLYAYLWQRTPWRSSPFAPHCGHYKGRVQVLGRTSSDRMIPPYNDEKGIWTRTEHHPAIYMCRVITATNINAY